MGSFVPFGGFFSSPLDPKSPKRSKNQYSTCCYLCTEKFEHEVAAILKERSITSVADRCSEKLPSWLERAELDTRKGVDMAKVCQVLQIVESLTNVETLHMHLFTITIVYTYILH